MKRFALIFLLGFGAWGLMSCAETPVIPELSAEAELPAVTTTAADAETTAVTTATTAAETDAPAETTAAAEDDTEYQEAEDIELFVDITSIRAGRCTAKMINHDVVQRAYTYGYRVLDADTEQECRILSTYDPEEDEKDAKETRWIKPDEKRSLQYDWTDRYGDLTDGTYIIEVMLEKQTVYPEEGGEKTVAFVARADFDVEAEGFVPNIYIAPGDVSPTGVTLTIDNSADAGRSYAFVYRLYDETAQPRKEMLKVFDKEARLSKNYYVKAGETMLLPFDWSQEYGPLLEGSYAIEIELLADGETEGKSYHVEFEIAAPDRG